MKWKAMWMLAVGGSLLAPSAAWACDSAFGYLFMRTTVSRFAVTGALQTQPGSDGDDTYLIPSLDVSFPLGSRAVVRPMLGFCTGGGESEIVFGGGGAYNFWNNPAGTFGLNLQAALTGYTFDGGSDLVVPISVAGLWEASQSAGLIFGAGLQLDRYSYSVPGFDGSETGTDPFAIVGGQFNSGNVGFQAGLLLKKGESDTDIALNASVIVGVD